MTYDVLGIGNAIVDVLSETPDAFLQTHHLAKGGMTLIDEKTAHALYEAMPPATEQSGGSAANTIAGLALCGAKAAFIGKVRDDALGTIFAHDLRSLGVTYTTSPATEGASTARCLICVTPDAQRTMATYLGATRAIRETDIDPELIAQSKVIYIEGYLWDEPNAKQAIRAAIHEAKQSARKIAFTLSDTFCVERHRDEFWELIHNSIDLLFANESELKALTQQADFESSLPAIVGKCEVVAITRSEKGSVIVHEDRTLTIPAKKNLTVRDTTGAGDLYAAGFLYGYTQGKPLVTCGEWATLAASEVIQKLGARLTQPLFQA